MADARAARGIAYRNLGRLDQAEEDLRFAIRTAEELGDRQIPPWTWRNLAVVAELRGDNATAAEWLKRAKDAESRGPLTLRVQEDQRDLEDDVRLTRTKPPASCGTSTPYLAY
jgi:Flp pilus assembly protein TadD